MHFIQLVCVGAMPVRMYVPSSTYARTHSRDDASDCACCSIIQMHACAPRVQCKLVGPPYILPTVPPYVRIVVRHATSDVHARSRYHTSIYTSVIIIIDHIPHPSIRRP